MSLHLDTSVTGQMRVGEVRSVRIYVDDGDGDTSCNIDGANGVLSPSVSGSQNIPDDGNGLEFTVEAVGVGTTGLNTDAGQIQADVWNFSGSFNQSSRVLGQTVTPTFALSDGGKDIDVLFSNQLDAPAGSYEVEATSGVAITPTKIGTYGYRIQFNDEGGLKLTEPSPTVVYTYATPSVPTGLAGTVISSSQVDLTWSDGGNANNPPSLYRIQVASDSGFSSIVQTQTTASTSISITGLTAGTQYWFHVRAENGTGNSSYTSSINKTTSAAATPEESDGSHPRRFILGA